MKTKRTYYLSEEAVHAVRELAASGIARSQDAVVEMAIAELARKKRDEEEAALWEQAASDPTFRADATQIAHEFRTADAEVWPK